MRRIQWIDGLFAISVLAALLVWFLLGGKAIPKWWTSLFFAVLCTAFVAYKIVRLILEYRAGVSVHFGRRSREGGDYDSATRPAAFWWAMALEATWFLLAVGACIALWVAFASS